MHIKVERFDQPLAFFTYTSSGDETELFHPSRVIFVKRWNNGSLPYYLKSCTAYVNGVKVKDLGNCVMTFEPGTLEIPKTKKSNVEAYGYRELRPDYNGFMVCVNKLTSKRVKERIKFFPPRTIEDKLEGLKTPQQ